MKTAFIIHGTYGNPKENWFPWLKKELEKLDYQVFVPKFPTPKNQTLNNWLKVFENYIDYLNKDSIFIGHSLGCAFILNILGGINQQVNSCFLVSAFIGELNNLELNKLNQDFTENKLNWKKIRQNCRKFTLFHSDNDSYVPLQKAEELKQKLNAELIIIKRAGHFNEEAGYNKFEKLKEIIQTQKD